MSESLTRTVREALARATGATSGEWDMDRVNFGFWQVTAPSSDGHPDYRRRVADSMTEPDAELVANAPAWLSALCDENERLQQRLTEWEERYPCDGMCSPNSGPEEDCSRHGRPPGELWEIITSRIDEAAALRASLDAAERVVEAARSVDVLLPSPSNIPTKTPELLASAIARLDMALDAYDAPDAALDAWRDGEGNE